ncbi:MAG TPA: serine hydrolase [Candidatus Saccharimonas sp.]|nr:serine hydrolase [Candidatus Saccharimonas sp.]
MKRPFHITLLVGIIALLGFWLSFEWNQIAPHKVNANAVTKTTTAQATASTQKESAQIQNMLQNFANRYPSQVSLVVVDLDNGASGSANATTQMVSASLYKMFVAYGIYQKIDGGELTKQSAVQAMGASVEDCLEAMIEVSDNDCGKALGDIVGWSALDAKLKTLGLTNTLTNNYDASGTMQGDKMTTAADVATFMRQLYTGTLLSKNSTADFIDLLKKDQVNDRLPTGLPAGTIIAHKTGDLYDVMHDAGFVYGPKGTYLVTMMTQDWDEPATQAPPLFTQLSQEVWRYFEL